MNNKSSIQQTIRIFEDSLVRYQDELKKDPDSFFYGGLVQNTREYIEELQEELQKQMATNNQF